ncbi:MAG: hypothetical protein R3Y26_07675 [Rikenellaceae bacterium]
MKYLSILRYALTIVSIVIVMLPFIQGGGETTDVDTMLNWTYGLVFFTIAAVIVLPLLNIAKNPKAAVRSLVGILIVGVIFAIAYSLSSSTPIEVSASKVYDNPLELKLSDTGLFMTYAAFGLSILSIFFGEVYKLFK